MGFELTTLHIVGISVGALFILLLGFGFAIARFYVRASADEALVRTGQGGTKVVIGGGTVCLPVLHQIMKVSLRTVTLTVQRVGKQALVTKDKIKAQCTMELYIRVDDTKEAIIKAAQSFGEQNVQGAILSEIVEGKLTDALRGVAAVQDFAQLHAEREKFAEAVKTALVEELAKNGLKLESTSLTELSQLPIEQMDPNDVHDAVGLQNITEIVADAQQRTNQLDRNKEVIIQEQDVKARETALRLTKEQALLEATQAREVAEFQAAQKAAERIAILAKEQESQEAAYHQKRALENAEIAQQEAVATRDLERQKALAEVQAQKDEAERTAQIRATKAIEAAEIEKQKAIEAAEIEKRKAIETAEIQKQVAIALADKEKAEAEAEKNLAEAKETEAQETIKTAEEKARADREKLLAVIKAEEEAQKAQIDVDRDAYTEKTRAEAALVVAQRQAEAERAKAEGRANAVRETAEAEADKERSEAQAEADKRRLSAQAKKDAADLEAEADAVRVTRRAEAESTAATLDAEAKIKLAEARLKEGEAEAEAERLLVEARNAVDSRLLMLDAAKEAIKVAPDVVREFVKSAEVIGDMKVLQINGLTGGGEDGEGGFMSELNKTPIGLGVSTLAQTAAVTPIIKALMEHSGVTSEALVSKVTDKVKAVTKAGLEELTKPEKESKPTNRMASNSGAKAKPSA